jgi:hypothetical protein
MIVVIDRNNTKGLYIYIYIYMDLMTKPELGFGLYSPNPLLYPQQFFLKGHPQQFPLNGLSFCLSLGLI